MISIIDSYVGNLRVETMYKSTDCYSMTKESLDMNALIDLYLVTKASCNYLDNIKSTIANLFRFENKSTFGKLAKLYFNDFKANECFLFLKEHPVTNNYTDILNIQKAVYALENNNMMLLEICSNASEHFIKLHKMYY